MLRQLWDRWREFGYLIGNLWARLILTLFYFTIFACFGLWMSRFSDRLGTKVMPERFWHDRETVVDSVVSMRRQA